MTINTVVWNEFIHERENAAVKAIYPDGIHATIARALGADTGIQVSTATLDEPEHGLSQARLDQTDVLLWWGNAAHGRVADQVALRVQQRVAEGMGFDRAAFRAFFEGVQTADGFAMQSALARGR